MRNTFFTALLGLGAACSSGPDRPEAAVTHKDFDRAAARARLDVELARWPVFKGAAVGPVPDLDVGGLFAFSAMPPSTGKAGEVLFWIGADEVLSTAQPTRDFDRLMARLGVGDRAGAVEVHQLALLFIRFRAMRRGVVLDRPDGHALLRPGAIAADAFHPPRLTHDAAGAHLAFWLFDTDRFEPSRWTVDIAPGGATQFTGP